MRTWYRCSMQSPFGSTHGCRFNVENTKQRAPYPMFHLGRQCLSQCDSATSCVRVNAGVTVTQAGFGPAYIMQVYSPSRPRTAAAPLTNRVRRLKQNSTCSRVKASPGESTGRLSRPPERMRQEGQLFRTTWQLLIRRRTRGKYSIKA